MMNNENPFATLSQPAQRALAHAGIQTLQELAKLSKTEFLNLHGVGPKSIRMIKQIMDEQGLVFATE